MLANCLRRLYVSQEEVQPSVEKLTIDDSREKVIEKREREALEVKMLAYNFLKHLPSKDDTLHDLYAYCTQGSNIYYMELVDENPDSTDTMRYVAELLLSAASCESQAGYVILVGDRKTYQHLIEVK